MKIFLLTCLVMNFAWAQCPSAVDLLVVGDSQTGATWSKSYFGNFLAACLKGNFVVYARGGTVPGNWLASGGMDQIETIQRDPQDFHLNIGSKENVPLCKKRISSMLGAHQPKKVFFQFGGNMISLTESEVGKQIELLMTTVTDKGIKAENCFFMTPTFEMAVATNRNVPTRNLQASMKIHSLIDSAIKGRCQVISGVELMKDSPFFDGKELLKRIPVAGKPGCSGAAQNDNVHVCGEAAQDMAQRICERLN